MALLTAMVTAVQLLAVQHGLEADLDAVAVWARQGEVEVCMSEERGPAKRYTRQFECDGCVYKVEFTDVKQDRDWAGTRGKGDLLVLTMTWERQEGDKIKYVDLIFSDTDANGWKRGSEDILSGSLPTDLYTQPVKAIGIEYARHLSDLRGCLED